MEAFWLSKRFSLVKFRKKLDFGLLYPWISEDNTKIYCFSEDKDQIIDSLKTGEYTNFEENIFKWKLHQILWGDGYNWD